jgi:hypothetical protein
VKKAISRDNFKKIISCPFFVDGNKKDENDR